MLAQSTIGSRFEFDTEDAWPVIPAPSFALLLLISQRGRINPGDVDCSKSARDAVPARQRQTRWAQQALWTGPGIPVDRLSISAPQHHCILGLARAVQPETVIARYPCHPVSPPSQESNGARL